MLPVYSVTYVAGSYPHSCLSRGGREGSQFLRRVLRTKAKSLRFFEGSQQPAKQRSGRRWSANLWYSDRRAVLGLRGPGSREAWKGGASFLFSTRSRSRTKSNIPTPVG